MRMALILLACVATVSTSGCVSSRMSDSEPDRLFRAGDYESANKALEKGIKKQGPDGRDLLLYLLDSGLSLHMAKQYEASNKAFMQADKIAEIKDYTSLATEGATLLTSENIKDYKGEDFEKVLINVYLSMNFALMGEYDDALVEARRVNRKLQMMITDGQRKYKQNAFARYLSAILYESQGRAADGNFYNDAYIDYKLARELDGSIPDVGRDLYRMAYALRMTDEMEKWSGEYSLTAADKKEAKFRASKADDRGEIVVVYQNGISPKKIPSRNFASIPEFIPRFNPVRSAKIAIDGNEVGEPYLLHDIEYTAIENLKEKYAGIIAKKIAGIVAKEVVSDRIEKATNSPLLGFISKVFFYVSDQADVRSWNLLPRDLQILRTRVKPGLHTVQVLPEGASSLTSQEVQVAARKTVFVNFRYMP